MGFALLAGESNGASIKVYELVADISAVLVFNEIEFPTPVRHLMEVESVVWVPVNLPVVVGSIILGNNGIRPLA